MNKDQLAKMMDHTELSANAQQADIDAALEIAKEYSTASLCVNSSWVPYVHQVLEGTGVLTCSVVGFPLGAMAKEAKLYETEYVLEHGADEVDMVINIGKLLDGDYGYVQEEIQALTEKVHAYDRLIKVIIETSYLTEEQIVKACELSKAAGADFVKTSTGMSSEGATLENVRLMRQTVGQDLGVKASGDIRDLETAQAMVEAGASRLGVSRTASILGE